MASSSPALQSTMSSHSQLASMHSPSPQANPSHGAPLAVVGRAAVGFVAAVGAVRQLVTLPARVDAFAVTTGKAVAGPGSVGRHARVFGSALGTGVPLPTTIARFRQRCVRVVDEVLRDRPVLPLLDERDHRLFLRLTVFTQPGRPLVAAVGTVASTQRSQRESSQQGGSSEGRGAHTQVVRAGPAKVPCTGLGRAAGQRRGSRALALRLGRRPPQRRGLPSSHARRTNAVVRSGPALSAWAQRTRPHLSTVSESFGKRKVPQLAQRWAS